MGMVVVGDPDRRIAGRFHRYARFKLTTIAA
jgi:hypothetical protein